LYEYAGSQSVHARKIHNSLQTNPARGLREPLRAVALRV